MKRREIKFLIIFIILIYLGEIMWCSEKKYFMLDSFEIFFRSFPGAIVPASNPLRYMSFNAFDGDLQTAVALNEKYKISERESLYFRIKLKTNIVIDEVRIYGMGIKKGIYLIRISG